MTVSLVVGYSWQDATLPTLAEQGFGINVAWVRSSEKRLSDYSEKFDVYTETAPSGSYWCYYRIVCISTVVVFTIFHLMIFFIIVYSHSYHQVPHSDETCA